MEAPRSWKGKSATMPKNWLDTKVINGKKSFHDASEGAEKKFSSILLRNKLAHYHHRNMMVARACGEAICSTQNRWKFGALRSGNESEGNFCYHCKPIVVRDVSLMKSTGAQNKITGSHYRSLPPSPALIMTREKELKGMKGKSQSHRDAKALSRWEVKKSYKRISLLAKPTETRWKRIRYQRR